MQNLAAGKLSKPHVGQFMETWRQVQWQAPGLFDFVCKPAPRAMLAERRQGGNVESNQATC
jgi:hypothetical protein